MQGGGDQVLNFDRGKRRRHVGNGGGDGDHMKQQGEHGVCRCPGTWRCLRRGGRGCSWGGGVCTLYRNLIFS